MGKKEDSKKPGPDIVKVIYFDNNCESDVEFEAFRDPDHLKGGNSLLVFLTSILERFFEACGQYSVNVEALHHEAVANKARRKKDQKGRAKRRDLKNNHTFR